MWLLRRFLLGGTGSSDGDWGIDDGRFTVGRHEALDAVLLLDLRLEESTRIWETVKR